MNISVIEYEHRDSGNWKIFDYFYVKGELTLEQLSKYMIRTEFFYPKDVGIPPLDPDNVFAGCPEFHDVTDIRPFDPNRDALPEKNLRLLISAAEMVRRFKRHKKLHGN